MILSKNLSQAKKSLLLAMEKHKSCVRANILLGDICENEGKFDEAISFWKKIEYQRPEYLGLVASKIINAYQSKNKINEGLSTVSRYYDLYKLKTLLDTLFETVISNEGPKKAEKIARNELIQRPSLLALDQLFQALAISKNNQIDNIELIQQTIKILSVIGGFIPAHHVVLREDNFIGNALHVIHGNLYHQSQKI